VQSEEFFIDQVDPDCFFVDRHCMNDPDKTGRFVAEKIFRSVEDVQNDPLYPTARTRDLEPSPLVETERLRFEYGEGYRAQWQWDSSVNLPENEIVVLYEIYDLKHDEVLTLARGAEDILRGPEPIPEGVDGHPYVVYKTNERRSKFYPVPTIFNWMGPQFEYNLTRNQTAIHRKRFNRKYGYLKDRIDPAELDKLKDGEDGIYVMFNAEGAVEPIKDAPLDPAVYFDTKVLKEEFMEISHVGKLQRSQTGAESATEAEIVERRSREGEIDEHEAMMEFLSEIARKLHACMEANLTQEAAIEKIGPEGRKWISFGPEHFEKIAAEVIFEVKAEEATRMTLQVERAQLLQFIDIIGKNPILALDDVMLRALMNKFPALADNELLIERVQKLAQIAVMMQIQEAKTKREGSSKAKGATKTADAAKSSRQVASR